ncbi:MAG: phytanoyl-CoA dioxygenase [Planctomycetota bacterium]|nr:MAG: phytanoyl-CoA dioxygenase [Planctomycetota bacterium]
MTDLPPTHRFQLLDTITPEQQAFLDHYGFLHFEGVAKPDEVDMILEEMDQLEQNWRQEGRRKVNGVPLFWGRGPGEKTWLQRFAFSSAFSRRIREFVHHSRFEPIRTLIGADARVGDQEKDGVVINRYINLPGSVYPKLGWHTDGLRDLFYLKMPKQMLNVGLHLDDCGPENGGLRLIPCSHSQGFWSMCFRKFYFVSHKADPKEICVSTRRGDLTVHDGRLWHRVAQSSRKGLASIRRTMYVPYLTGPYQPKSETSGTPGYHFLGALMRRWQTRKFRPAKNLGV